MKKILDLISEEVVKAFEEAGYSADFAKVMTRNSPKSPSPTGLIYVNISVMVHWQQQKPTKKLRS